MALFPQTIAPLSPHQFADRFLTLRGPRGDSGRVVTAAARNFSIYTAQPRFALLPWANYTDHWAFFQARRGGSGTFTWYDWLGHDAVPIGIPWVKIYAGIRDGSTTVFDLPSYSASSYTLYSNGSALTAGGVDWTFGAAAGTDGRDRATLAAAGTAGHVLEFSFRGRRAHTVRFASDELVYEARSGGLVAWGVEIEEVR